MADWIFFFFCRLPEKKVVSSLCVTRELLLSANPSSPTVAALRKEKPPGREEGRAKEDASELAVASSSSKGEEVVAGIVGNGPLSCIVGRYLLHFSKNIARYKFGKFLFLSVLIFTATAGNDVSSATSIGSSYSSSSSRGYEWSHGDVRVKVTFGNGGGAGADAPPSFLPRVWFCYGSSDGLCVTRFPYGAASGKKALVVRRKARGEGLKEGERTRPSSPRSSSLLSSNLLYTYEIVLPVAKGEEKQEEVSLLPSKIKVDLAATTYSPSSTIAATTAATTTATTPSATFRSPGIVSPRRINDAVFKSPNPPLIISVPPAVSCNNGRTSYIARTEKPSINKIQTTAAPLFPNTSRQPRTTDTTSSTSTARTTTPASTEPTPPAHTVYGEPCRDACRRRGYSYTWCHKRRPSDIGTWSDSDYCSAEPGTTPYGDRCTDGCSRRGYEYYWCHKETALWGYCTPDHLVVASSSDGAEPK